MSAGLGQFGFRFAVFLILVSGALLFFQKPDTAEFVITLTTLILGLLFAAIIIVLVRRAND